MILEGVAQPPTRCRFVSTTLPIPKYDTRRNENGGRGRGDLATNSITMRYQESLFDFFGTEDTARVVEETT